jgi:hypothetical protein
VHQPVTLRRKYHPMSAINSFITAWSARQKLYAGRRPAGSRITVHAHNLRNARAQLIWFNIQDKLGQQHASLDAANV